MKTFFQLLTLDNGPHTPTPDETTFLTPVIKSLVKSPTLSIAGLTRPSSLKIP